MSSDVPHKSLGVHERVITVLTLEALFSLVTQQVRRDILSVVELFAAVLALERLHARVLNHVSFQTRLLLERFRARGTLVGFLLIVRLHVTLQPVCPRETPPAVLTRERPFARVDALMRLPVGKPLESFFAEGTVESPFFGGLD